MSEKIIHLTGLEFSWDMQTNPVVKILDLQVNRGENVFIKGASGCGKTTLLNLITGIFQPTSGEIEVLGVDLPDLAAARRDKFRVDHFGIIFQQFNLLPYLSVEENVELPCWFSPKRRANAGALTKAAHKLLAELKISSKMTNRKVSELSVGQQQRVAVARALIGQPDIIIADEPTSALDSDNRERFMDLLFTEVQRQNSTLVFVSHDERLAQRFDNIIDFSKINQADMRSDDYATD